MKVSNIREPTEKNYLSCYIQFSIPFFHDMNKLLLDAIVERLDCQKFTRGDYLMEQGACGDNMFIIMEGECGIYVTNTRA